MSSNRLQRQADVACSIVKDVESAVARGIPADQQIALIFREHPGFGSRDRRHYAHVVFAWFRWRGWIEQVAAPEIIDQCAWAVALDPATPPEIASIWNEVRPIPPEEIERVRATHSLDALMPPWLVEIMPEQSERHRFIRACAKRPPTWLAIDPHRAKEFSRFLSARKISHQLDGRLPGAAAIHDRFDHAVLERDWGSALQIQDIASQAVVSVCAARMGESWWDACSGAGGKSLSLARAVGESGSVYATDVRASVLEILRMRARRHDLSWIQTAELDAMQRGTDRMFDGVLVDAPCSGIGTWPRNPDARWRTTMNHVKENVAKQLALLDRAAAHLKTEGMLVYSVCTMSRNEGEEVIAHFLDRHPGFALTDVVHPLTRMTAHGNCPVHPDQGPGDGMFAAKMVRQA